MEPILIKIKFKNLRKELFVQNKCPLHNLNLSIFYHLTVLLHYSVKCKEFLLMSMAGRLQGLAHVDPRELFCLFVW